jgi:hypothetical protein
MGDKCGAHYRHKKSVQNFGWEALREKDHMEDPRSRCQRQHIKMARNERFDGVEWIHLAYDREQW